MASPLHPLAVEIAAHLCSRWEGYRERPYLCPAGVPTIGYGFTHYPDGRRVQLTDPPMSQEHAQRVLVWFLENRYLPEVVRLCPVLLKHPERLGAIGDFNFNLGPTNLAASTLRKRINAERWEDVPIELRKWVRAGGKILKGLVLRREAEAAYI